MDKHSIKIGTSGFSFDDWKGTVYPEKIKKSDMLRYYEQELGFDTTEINFTYYALAGQKTFEGLANKTGDDFDFSVKAYKGMTHDVWDQETKKRIDNKEIFEKFNFSIEPLINTDKLTCVVAQFPYWFHCNKDNFSYLKEFKDRMKDTPVVVEFRNIEWHKSSVTDFLRDNELGYCVVDEPKLKGLMPFNPEATSDIGYFRFHGRNKKWFNQPMSVRYNYLYADSELKEFSSPIEKVLAMTQMIRVYFNNCHLGSAAKNAKTFKKMLGLGVAKQNNLFMS